MDIRFLHDHSLTRGFREEELAELHDVLEPVSVDANTTLVAEGQQTEGLFVIGEGNINVAKLSSNGTLRTLAELHSPTLIGEMELLTKRPAAASAVTVTPVQGGKLTHEKFLSLIESGDVMVSKLILNISRVLVLRLEATNDRLVSLVQPEKVRELDSFREQLISNWNF